MIIIIDVKSFNSKNNCFSIEYEKDNKVETEEVLKDNIEDFIEELIGHYDFKVKAVYIRNKNKNYHKFKYPRSQIFGGYPFIEMVTLNDDGENINKGKIVYSERKSKPMLSLCNARLARAFEEIIKD